VNNIFTAIVGIARIVDLFLSNSNRISLLICNYYKRNASSNEQILKEVEYLSIRHRRNLSGRTWWSRFLR